MTRETSTDFWIGLNDLISEGIFLWTDNSPRKYTYWNVSEPSNNEQSMGCVLMNPHQDEGRWRTASCNQRNGFICETGLWRRKLFYELALNYKAIEEKWCQVNVGKEGNLTSKWEFEPNTFRWKVRCCIFELWKKIIGLIRSCETLGS